MLAKLYIRLKKLEQLSNDDLEEYRRRVAEMAKRLKKEKKERNVPEILKELIHAIMSHEDITEDAVGRMDARTKAIKILLKKASKKVLNPEDPCHAEDLVGCAVGEFIFSTMDEEEYKEFLEDVVESYEDEEYEGSSESSPNRKKKKKNRDSDLETWLKEFERFLDTNDYARQPNFVTFCKLVDKFKLKKICTFPAVETMNVLYKEFEDYMKA